MTISVRNWGAPTQTFAATGTSLSVTPGNPIGLLPTDISVLTIQASPSNTVVAPPVGWTAVGGGVVNTHPNKVGADSFVAMFIRKGSLATTIVSATRTAGAGWLKAQITSYQKDTEPDWSYSVTIDDYSYGANSITGTGLFLTLESNVTVPITNEPFVDDFTELSLSDWAPYDGVGHGNAGLRLPINAAVIGGVLTLVGTPEGKTGGIRLKRRSQQYGHWEFRARSKPGAGYYRPVIRLWGVNGGEGDNNVNGSINALEAVRSPTRAVNTVSINYDAGGPQQQKAEVAIDLTQWHRYIVRWEQGGIFFYIDDVLVWATYDITIQPVGPVDLCIMLEYYVDEVVAISDKRQAPVANHLAASFEVDYIRQYPLDYLEYPLQITQAGSP